MPDIKATVDEIKAAYQRGRASGMREAANLFTEASEEGDYLDAVDEIRERAAAIDRGEDA